MEKNKALTDKPCALYRHYDEAGVLLYVGISISPLNRFMQHEESSTWSSLVASTKIERFDTRKKALIAERDAIKSEKPLHNIHHNRENKKKQSSYDGFKLRPSMIRLIKFIAPHLSEDIATRMAKLACTDGNLLFDGKIFNENGCIVADLATAKHLYAV